MHILLADHRPKTRFALRTLLKQWFEFAAICEAANAGELLIQIEAACPDLVLLDWTLRGQKAITLLPVLRTHCASVAVIVLGGRPEWRGAALDAGADAFISKGDPPDHLLAAIENLWDKKTTI